MPLQAQSGCSSWTSRTTCPSTSSSGASEAASVSTSALSLTARPRSSVLCSLIEILLYGLSGNNNDGPQMCTKKAACATLPARRRERGSRQNRPEYRGNAAHTSSLNGDQGVG